MDYSFRREETSAFAARRIAKEQLERAIAELGASADVDRSVHNVRKRLKKLRGLLRLLRGALGRRTFERENLCYRDAGRRLSGPRRAAATLGAFDALLARHPEVVSPEAAGALRQTLVAERDRIVLAMQGENHALGVAESLSLSLARVDSWPLEAESWSMLAVGFEQSYARGRRALRRAERQPTTEHLHDWRKHAKYHWYHVRLLERTWPNAMQALKLTLERLTEELGAEHDLDDLRLLLLEHAPPEALRDATARLLGALQARREELRASAFSRGQHVYAESPDAAVSRFARYHAAWLSDPESEDGDAGADD